MIVLLKVGLTVVFLVFWVCIFIFSFTDLKPVPKKAVPRAAVRRYHSGMMARKGSIKEPLFLVSSPQAYSSLNDDREI